MEAGFEVGIDTLTIFGIADEVLVTDQGTGLDVVFDTGGEVFLSGLSAGDLGSVFAGAGFDVLLV